jgi:alpha-tubulin suppressor-like RCC1 family protein
MRLRDSRGAKPQAMRMPLSAAAVLITLAFVLLATAQTALAVEKPVNTVLPTIAGTPKEGVTLKAKKGSWTGGSLVWTYQWQRCEPESECVNIVSATTSEYKLRFIDIGSQIRVIVTASNSAGSTEATSEKTVPVAPVPPKNTALPAISGRAVEGQLLSVSTGTWSGTPATAYGYKWERCTPAGRCSAISGATNAEYVVAPADVGDTLRAAVADTNPAGTVTARSLPTATVTHGPPVALDFPAITGALRLGGTLHASTGTWKGLEPIEYEYKWESCNGEGSCVQFSVPTSLGASYTLTARDVGNRIKVLVTATNSLGTATSSSTATPNVLGALENFAAGWGEDWRGALGTQYRALWEERPVTAEGENHLVALSQGNGFTLWLHEDGTLTAAGAGANGQLGYGGRQATWEQGKTHVAVSGLSGVKAMSSGGEYSTALMNDATVKVWGNNAFAVLGNGHGGFEKYTGENQLVPKDVKALDGAGVVAVSSGGGAQYALLPGGQVEGWGRNDVGQLSIPWPTECMTGTTCELEARKASEEAGTREVAHMCSTEIGWIACAKRPTTVMELEGTTERPLKEVAQISTGYQMTLARLESGEVLTWGNDGKGQLGQTLEPGPHTTWTRPGRVMVNATESLKHVVSVAAGYNFGLAVLEDGSLVGWGNNTTGQLGPLTGTCGKEAPTGGGTWPCDRYATPIALPSGISAAEVVAGVGFTGVLGSDGRVYTVGSNSYGTLGIGPICENEGGEMGFAKPCYSRVWHAVPGLEDVRAVSANQKGMSVIVGGRGTPPLPVVNVEPGSRSAKLQWQLPGEQSTKLAVRVWEHPVTAELAEGAEEEEEVIEEAGTPPVNETQPLVRAYEYVEGEKKKVRGGIYVGQYLEAFPGNWRGTPPLTYEYRWLRCDGGECSPVTGWVHGGAEKGEQLHLTEEDAGFQMKAQVAARHESEARGIAASEPTEVVKAEGERRKASAEPIILSGLDGRFFNLFEGKPLETVQYEFKLSSLGGPKGTKVRSFIAAPLP